MKHFRDLLTAGSRFEYLAWRVLHLQRPLELRLRQGEKVLIRPLPAEDYGSAMEVFLDEVYHYPRKIAPGSVQRIVDLGANVGCSCLYWLRQFPASRVVAFEPHPVHVDILRSNLARNGSAERVTIHAGAAGTRSGQAFLTDQGMSSRLTAGAGPKSYGVPVFDFFATIGSAAIDILKIDIEGAEYDLLADDRLLTLPVKTIVMEWHPCEQYPGDTGAAWCRQRLEEAGFTVEDHGGFQVLWGFR